MKIESLSPSHLVPYARNAKLHNDRQVQAIAASIREFGFNNPVLIDSAGGIIAGHGRVLAAEVLGLATIPCIRLSHLTDAQKRAYILADNRLSEIGGGWDESLLLTELSELASLAVDLPEIGFADSDLLDLDMMIAPDPEPLEDPEPQIDKAEELRVKWGVESGQLWELGDHRILCGDSTKAEDVERVLAGDKPLLMVTDPPYGVEYDPAWRQKAGIKHCKNNSVGLVTNDDRADWSEAWALFPGDVAYVWHAGNKAHLVAESLIACDLHIRAQIVWAKN